MVSIGLFVSAQAALIDLGYTGGQPASVAAELNRLNGQIGVYNLANDPDLTLATSPLWGGIKTETPNGGTSITLDLNGEGYLLLKYGPVDRFYYFNFDTLTAQTFNSDVYDFNNYEFPFATPNAAGLSHYTTFTPVPEPATWWAGACLLLPFAASTLRAFRPNSLFK